MGASATTPTEAPTARLDVSPAVVDVDVPRLASDVELIGRFEDSGFKEPPYLARRGDGQIIQLAPMLFALAEEIDGRRTTDEVAEAFSERIERQVTAEMVGQLLDEQLRRLGIVALRDGVTGEVQKLDPLLALKFRTKVIPDGVVRAITTVFRPLFLPPVMAAVVLAFVALIAWLFGVHGVSQGLRHVIYQPALMFLLLGGVVVATAFHEIGHATAVRYGGAKPGVMGMGIYIVWPAFYTDITDAYRLPKWGRLRADVGGMYFNMVFALAAAGAYAATGFEPLLLLVVLQAFAIVQQSLPFLRLDGYYIVSDLTGVPDILTRIRSVLASLLPWRDADERVTELKPWVRVVVSAYVLVLVPVLILIFAVLLVHAPRMFATAYDSLAVRYDRVAAGEPLGPTAKDVLQMIVLTLPCLGLVYTTSRIAGHAGRGAWRWSDGSAARRLPLVAAATTAVAFVGFLWWPDGDYRPIQRGDRGTVIGALGGLRHIPSGHAAVPVAQPQVTTTPQSAAPQPQTRTTEEQPAKAKPKANGVTPAPTTTSTTSTTAIEPEPTGTTTTRGSTVEPQSTAEPQPEPTGTSTSVSPEPTSTTTTPTTETVPEDTSGSSVYPGGD